MIALRDGRKVAFEQYGDPAGEPALWFHGAFSCRLEGAYLDAAARELGVRLVSLDRPGVGGSDPHPARTVVGYASDCAEVLDALGIEQAAVGGLSNGGMFAMAVAATLPSRVLRAVPVNPSTPIADPAAYAALSRKGRLAYTLMLKKPSRISDRLESGKQPGRFATWLTKRSNPDAWLWEDPQVAATMTASAAEVVRQRGSGYLLGELALMRAPWGFDHRAVPVPVSLVSGAKDAGLDYARVWARELPQGELVVLPGGHGNLPAPDVARRVVSCLRGPRPA